MYISAITEHLPYKNYSIKKIKKKIKKIKSNTKKKGIKKEKKANVLLS